MLVLIKFVYSKPTFFCGVYLKRRFPTAALQRTTHRSVLCRPGQRWSLGPSTLEGVEPEEDRHRQTDRDKQRASRVENVHV